MGTFMWTWARAHAVVAPLNLLIFFFLVTPSRRDAGTKEVCRHVTHVTRVTRAVLILTPPRPPPGTTLRCATRQAHLLHYACSVCHARCACGRRLTACARVARCAVSERVRANDSSTCATRCTAPTRHVAAPLAYPQRHHGVNTRSSVGMVALCDDAVLPWRWPGWVASGCRPAG